MPYVMETCSAGRTVEYRKYYAPRFEGKGGTRMPRVRPTEAAVKKANRRKSERDLRRLMNHNFDLKSWHVTLTFKESPSIEDLQKAVAKYTRRLRILASRKDKEVKYIYVLGLGTRARHVHMIVSGLSAEDISDAWKAGHVNLVKIYTENLRDLAAYFMENAENSQKIMKEQGMKPGRKWNGSRNLVKPIPKRKIVDAKTYRKEPPEHKGFYIDKESVYAGISGFTGLPFFEYTYVKIEEARCG